MKRASLLLALGFSSVGVAQVRLVATFQPSAMRGGNPTPVSVVGDARYHRKLLPNGDLRTHLVFSARVRVGGSTNRDEKWVKGKFVNLFGADGSPKRLETTVTGTILPALKSVATYTRAGVRVVQTPGNVKRWFPLLPTSEISSSARFWFIKRKPNRGETIRYIALPPQSLRWTRSVKTYVGAESLTLGGRRYRAHRIRQASEGQTTDDFVDDQGYPLVIDMGPIRLERAP